MNHPIYRCARCGRRLVRPGIADTAGSAFGPACAEKVGLILVRAKRKRRATVTHRRVARADQPELFEGVV